MTSLEGVKILVVDDVPDNIDVLFHLLDDAGVDILVAVRGEQALKVVAHNKPDVILLDVRMPEMDGYETCRRLRQMDGMADLPIVFLTAHGDGESRAEGMAAGGTDYLSKPVMKEALFACIQKNLKKG